MTRSSDVNQVWARRKCISISAGEQKAWKKTAPHIPNFLCQNISKASLLIHLACHVNAKLRIRKFFLWQSGISAVDSGPLRTSQQQCRCRPASGQLYRYEVCEQFCKQCLTNHHSPGKLLTTWSRNKKRIFGQKDFNLRSSRNQILLKRTRGLCILRALFFEEVKYATSAKDQSYLIERKKRNGRRGGGVENGQIMIIMTK